MYGKRDSLAPPRNKHSPLGCSSPTCESNMSYTVPPTVPKRRWQNVFSSGRKEGASSSPLLFTTLCTMAHAAGNGQKNQRSNAPILVKCLHVLVRQTARDKRTGSRIESHPICQRGESHPSEAGRPWQLSRRHAPTLPYVTSLHAIPPFLPPIQQVTLPPRSRVLCCRSRQGELQVDGRTEVNFFFIFFLLLSKGIREKRRACGGILFFPPRPFLLPPRNESYLTKVRDGENAFLFI